MIGLVTGWVLLAGCDGDAGPAEVPERESSPSADPGGADLSCSVDAAGDITDWSSTSLTCEEVCDAGDQIEDGELQLCSQANPGDRCFCTWRYDLECEQWLDGRTCND